MRLVEAVDIVLGDDAAMIHGSWLTLDGHDPVHQHERFIRQAHAGRETVCLGKLRTKTRRVELAYFGALSRTTESYEEHLAIIQAVENEDRQGASAGVRRN